MEIFGDYHTHTFYSDGTSKISDNIKKAIETGLKEVAITDHGFNNPTMYSLSRKKFQNQKKEIAEARKKYGSAIKIYHGIEADLISLEGYIDLKDSEIFDKEILLVGYHSLARPKSMYDLRKIYINSYLSFIKYPSKEVIGRNTKALINSIKKYPIDIIVHINHLFNVDCYEVAKACNDYGTLLEINNKHNHMDHEIFEKILTTDVDFIINSDAHFVSSVGDFSNAEIFLSKHNFDLNRIKNYKQLPKFKIK